MGLILRIKADASEAEIDGARKSKTTRPVADR
jgi:hypothetical protein